MARGAVQRDNRERNRRIKQAEEERKAKAAVTLEGNTGTDSEASAPDAGKSDKANDKTARKAERAKRREQKKADKAERRKNLKQAKEREARQKERRARRDTFWKHRPLKIVLCVIGVALMILASGYGIYYLITGVQDETTKKWDRTGTVAATYMGDNIMEDSITKQIMSTRESYGNDTEWAQYLVDSGETPESLRKSTIQSYESSILMDHALRDNGLSTSVTQSQLDAWWDANQDAYSAYGLTKEQAATSYSSIIQRWVLEEKVTPRSDITDQDVLDYLNENADKYNGTRKSSHILFSSDDSSSTDTANENTNTDGENAKSDEDLKKQAQETRDKIMSGELSFEDAVQQFSGDTASKEENGNVGWDYDASFVEAYETALKALNKGEISPVTKSDYGYHIIMCTDEFSWSGTLDDINTVPEEIKKSVIDELQSERFNEWYSDYQSKADDTEHINDMPEGLPYDVSLDGIEPSNANNTTSNSTFTVDNGEVVTSGDSSVTVSSDSGDSSDSENADASSE